MRTEPSFPTSNNSDNFIEQDSPFLDDYRQRYGLSCDPFADDPHFPFYTGAQRRLILEKLVHLCQFANNLLVVVGEYSAGKTRMAQALIDSLEDEDDICFLEGQINSRFIDMLDEIVEQFELQGADDLTDFFEKTSESEGVAVVIIDNAHHLDDDTLRELLLLMRPNSDSRLRIIFLGEPLLLQRLENMDVSHVVMTDFSLERFDLPEAVDYLNFRMEMSDYLGPELFNETIVESWWRSANGQIDRLHACAQQKLLESVSASATRSQLSGGFPMTHILAITVLATILIMGFFYFGIDSGKTKKESHSLADGLATTTTSRATALPVSNVNVVSSNSSIANTTLDQASLQDPLQAPPEVAVETKESIAIEKNQSSSLIKEDYAAAPSLNSQKSRKKVGASSTPNLNPNETDLREEVSSKGIRESVLEKKNSAISSSSKLNLDSEMAINSKEKVQAGSDFTEQEKTILSWDDSEHTIQIVGLSTEKSAHEFIEHQPNRNELLLFKTSRQGKDWFVVVYGHFATTAEARNAVQSLPESQQKSTPWSRTVKIIKKEIRSR